MISKVLAWKKRAPQQGTLSPPPLTYGVADYVWTLLAADDLWAALKESNGKLATEFTVMTRLTMRGNVELRKEDATGARVTQDQVRGTLLSVAQS